MFGRLFAKTETFLIQKTEIIIIDEMKIPPEQAPGYPKLIVIFNLALVKPPMQASGY